MVSLSRRIARAALLAVAALAVGAEAAGATEVPGCGAPAPGGDWPSYGGTLDNHREQLGEQTITTANVAQLGVAWQLAMPDGGVIHSTPVVADGCVFTGTDLGNVYAINADTGKVVWTQALGGGGDASPFQGAGLVGAPAVSDGLVYVAATTPSAAILAALDQVTGAVVWSQAIDDDAGGGVDSSPVPFDGMVFQAYKGDESSNHSNPGYVIVDGSREGGGRVLVNRHVIPDVDYAAGDRGGSIVDTPPVDLQTRMLYAGTGNPVSPRQHRLTNALLKIDVDPGSPTFGKIVGSRRGKSDSYPIPGDVVSPVCQTELQWPVGRFTCAQFDYNFLSSPNLFRHSDGRLLLGGLQKAGVYKAVDATTMEPEWEATLGVPCFACNLSSTAVDASGIYVATTGGNLFALDRDTGAIKWAVPATGLMRYEGLTVANGIVYSNNDFLGALQAFRASDGAPLLTHAFIQDTSTPMQDTGNSSGISVARNTVFLSSQDGSTSTLFAMRLGASGGGGGGGGGSPPPQPPGGGGLPAAGGLVISGPGAASYGYLTPIVLASVGGNVSYTNLDAARHDVVAEERGGDGQPLFRSQLAGLGETVPVNGMDRVQAGKTYGFYCSVHPGMKGQLIVR